VKLCNNAPEAELKLLLGVPWWRIGESYFTLSLIGDVHLANTEMASALDGLKTAHPEGKVRQGIVQLYNSLTILEPTFRIDRILFPEIRNAPLEVVEILLHVEMLCLETIDIIFHLVKLLQQLSLSHSGLYQLVL